MSGIVTAEISGGRILAKIPWMNGRGRDLAKSIPGHRPLWDKTGPKDIFIGWTYPIAWSSCVALREVFGDALKVGPELTRWAWSEHRRREELEALRAGVPEELPRVRAEAPLLHQMLENRPFQLTGTAFIVKGRQVCLGDEPRLGKTYQALAALVETGVQTILVACPKTATYAVWAEKIKELLGEDAYVAQENRSNRDEVIAQFQKATGRRILVVNKEMIRIARRWACEMEPGSPKPYNSAKWCEEHQMWEGNNKPGLKHGCKGAHKHKHTYHRQFAALFDIVWDAVVLDECHHALASEKNYQSDNITQIRLGAVYLRMAPNGVKLAMSGTPFRSMLTKSWGVLNWLQPKVFSSFWQYAETHWKVKDGRYSKEIDRTRLKDPVAFDEALRPYYLARTKAQVAPQLPPVDYVDVLLPMEGLQDKAYQDMLADAQAEIEGGKITATGVLAELTRRRQFATAYGKKGPGRKVIPCTPSNKLDWILQFLEERDALQSKVVIASGFTEVVDLFTSEIRAKGYSVVNITGATSATERAEAQNEFLRGTTRVCFMNTFAGGEAIDLASADEMIFVDEPWNDDARQQAENRINSLSKGSQLTIFRLRSKGTVEEWIASLTDEQRAILLAAKPRAREMMQEAL